MYTLIIQTIALVAIITFSIFLLRFKGKKSKPVINYRIDTDTQYARYAINENGFLEEINQDKLSKHS